MNKLGLGLKKSFHMMSPTKRIADSLRMKKGIGKINKGLAPSKIKF